MEYLFNIFPFSDIKLMNLLNFLNLHSGYHEDAVRTIIRLEQAADAHMRREIASQGALAILYGHHLKHYIRKPEVLY